MLIAQDGNVEIALGVWHFIPRAGLRSCSRCAIHVDHRLMGLFDGANLESEKYSTVHVYMYSACCSKIWTEEHAVHVQQFTDKCRPIILYANK